MKISKEDFCNLINFFLKRNLSIFYDKNIREYLDKMLELIGVEKDGYIAEKVFNFIWWFSREGDCSIPNRDEEVECRIFCGSLL